MGTGILPSRATALLVFVLSVGAILGVSPAWTEEAPASGPEGTQSEDQAPADPEAPIIEYSRDPDTVVIMMKWEHGGEAADWDPTPLLRIYGDGRVDVRGYWESRLSEKEMAELLSSLAEKGVMDFDAEAVNQELDAIDAARGKPPEERYSSYANRGRALDNAPIIIELCLEKYKPAGAHGQTEPLFKKRIRRFDVQVDAMSYPNVKGVTDLAAAHLELQAIVERTISNKYEREK